MQGTQPQLHAAREHVDGGEDAPARQQQRPLGADLVVQAEQLVTRAQAVQQLHHVEPALGLQQSAPDQRAEDVGGLVQVVAFAPRRVQARLRLLQPLSRRSPLALVVLEV